MSNVTKSPVKDPEALLRRITAHFPDVVWKSYRYIDEGWDHEVIILDDRLVFRFPIAEEYLSRLQADIDILAHLKPLVSVRIPDYTYVAPDLSFAGYPLVPGRTLLKDVFDRLSAAEREQIAAQLAGFLSTLHKAPADAPVFSAIEPSDMKEHHRKVKGLAKQHLPGVLTAEELTIAGAILEDTDRVLDQPIGAVFVHGDLYHRHLLWDSETDRLGIIDFSDMNRGDPAFDFAELYEYGEDFVRLVYRLYTGPKDETFLERARIFGRWVGVFMMTSHFVHPKTSFAEARETFDRVKGSA